MNLTISTSRHSFFTLFSIEMPPRSFHNSNQAMFGDDPSADLAQPVTQAFGRYDPFVSPACRHTQEELLECRRAVIVGRRRHARDFDDAAGCIGRIETEIVGEPQAKELANIAELRILFSIESTLVIGPARSARRAGCAPWLTRPNSFRAIHKHAARRR